MFAALFFLWLTWHRPAFSGTRLPREQWENLPKELTVRIIRMNYEARTREKKRMTVNTTLTDPSKYDGMELHDLYAKRWGIETRLRNRTASGQRTPKTFFSFE